MSTMTAHAYLRNATGRAVAIHESAHPSPDTVEPDAVVRVDKWAAPSLRESGFDAAKAADWNDPNDLRGESEQHGGDQPADNTEAPDAEGDTEGDAS